MTGLQTNRKTAQYAIDPLQGAVLLTLRHARLLLPPCARLTRFNYIDSDLRTRHALLWTGAWHVGMF
jgi:hypothetical protein